MGHDEMRKYREVIMHTNSPQEPFPFDGDNLVDPNGQHLKRITKIKEQIQKGDLRLFRRRKEKQQKLLEYAGSLTPPMYIPHVMLAAGLYARLVHVRLCTSINTCHVSCKP